MRNRLVAALKPLTGDVQRAEAPFSDYDLDGILGTRRRALTAAAVLVPIVTYAEEKVLLTRRTDHLHDHPGQISFPGGRVEPEDAGVVATALRESREEVGLDEEHVDAIGLLDDYETVTGFLVTPVVALVRPGFTLELDQFEVAETFEVPVAFLLDRRNRQVHTRLRNGVERHYYVYEYGERYIWGATAGMIANLGRRLGA